MDSNKLKIAVLGAGHLGKIHLRILKDAPSYNLIGFYDPDASTRKKAEEELDVKAFQSMEELIDLVDVVDIVTPTLSHFDCAKASLAKGKHLFIEKPITNTLSEAEELRRLAKASKSRVQVGHVERFNPAFQAVENRLGNPMFIETHRLAQFNPRGTDVPVVLDLMIHDLDIILHAVDSEVRSVQASGVNVISDTPDIANARVEFENGCVANLTASRISMKNMRKSRFFQRDAYISVDFLEKKSEIVSMMELDGEPDPFAITMDPGNGEKVKEIKFEKPDIEATNAIGEELESLAVAIREDKTPVVSAHDGYKALALAHKIVQEIESRIEQ